MSHLHPDQLAALAIDDEIGEPGDVEHLKSCARCRQELATLRNVTARARRARPDQAMPVPPEAVWENVVQELTESGDLLQVSAPRWRPWAYAAAVALLAVAAAAVLLRPSTGPVVASADLEPLAEVSAAQAQLVTEGDASILQVSAVDLPPIEGYYELWLLTADGEGLVSLGPLSGAERVRIPSSIDTDRFSVVDISREPPDGDPGHSTDSVLRGPLRSEA